VSDTLRFTAAAADLAALEADLGIIGKFEDDADPGGPGGQKLIARLGEIARQDQFQGQFGKRLLWHAPPDDDLRCRRYLLLGLGPRADFTLERYRRCLGEALVEADGLGAVRAAVALPPGDAGDAGALAMGLAIAEGALLGTYRFDRYRSESRAGRRHLREVAVAAGRAALPALKDGMADGERTAAATCLARDLVNEPAGTLSPPRMTEIAREVAGRGSGLEFKLFGPDDLRRMGMGGILGVSQGSHHPAQLIQLHYRPAGKAVGKVVLIGKGLTFDSGGLSIKTSEGMETMKCDMAGSAAVLGALSSLPGIAPAVEVVGLLGMAENMPGGGAIRPGDVLRIMNGKTVEVRNTDAEGRLVLADCLSYASTLEGVDAAIDLATLTGACVVALGPMTSGVMGNNRSLVTSILQAAASAGEKMWELPLYPEYREHIRSDIADVKNIGIRWGGAITAGLFLQEFVRADLAWTHIDIAGPAFGDKDYSYMYKGGTGAGVRTLIRYLCERAG
jgi:leucyl aminopeptidase